MNDEHIDIDRIAMEAHFLHALDIEDSQSESSLSDMERQDYIDIIKSQKETIDQLKGMVDNFERMINSLNATIKSLESKLSSRDESESKYKDQIMFLTSKVAELTSSLNAALEQLSRMKKDRYDRTAQNNRNKKSGSSKKSREEEKDDYDGSDSNASSDSSSIEPASKENAPEVDPTKVTSEFLDNPRGPRGPYTTMDAACVIEHKTALMPNVPEGWKFLTMKAVDEYTKISHIQCDRYEVAVYVDEFGIHHEYYSPKDPADTKFPHVNCVPGTHCSPELAASIILDTYGFHLPNHRNNAKMLYDGFQVSENTRLNWMRVCDTLLRPLEPQLKSETLHIDRILLNIDETWYRVREKLAGDGTKLGHYKKKYMWVIVNKRTKSVYFLYDNDKHDSRGMRPIQEFLEDYAGALQSDGYTVYKQLAKNNPNIEHLQCWAHVRAKFYYAAMSGTDKEAQWFVDQIGRLYLVESECLFDHLSAEATRERRNKRDVVRIMRSMKSRAEYLLSRGRVPDGSQMYKALNYMLNGWDDLQRYRECGDYSIDNSAAERAIRPVTVNRKNSLFHSSEKGMETASWFHSLIETGKARGLNLKNWMISLIREMMNGNQDYAGLLSGAYCA